MNFPLKKSSPSLLLVPAAAAVVLAFTACYASSGPGYTSVSGSVQVAADDDYVYYPGYEVYYSNVHHDYIYRDGNRWIRHSSPPRSWDRSAPSVHLDFHDAPERHHAEVVRSYPKNWHPQAHAATPAHRDDRHNNDRRNDDHRNDDHHDDHDDHR